MCSISDPVIKMQTFELTFDNIQLGSWTEDEWQKFTHKLFDLHPNVNSILENKVGKFGSGCAMDAALGDFLDGVSL